MDDDRPLREKGTNAMKTRLVKLVTLLFLVYGCACVFGSGEGSTLTVGQKLSDFELPSVAGPMVKFSEASKDQVVVLEFGATWCPPCNVMIDSLKEVKKAYKDQPVRIIDVDFGETSDTVTQHVKEKGIDYTVLIDSDAKIVGQYGLSGLIPYTVIVDKSGKMVFDKVGPMTFEELKEQLDPLLKP
jgi:peroxiredoxin